MKCPKCGWTGSGTDKFCRMCGCQLEQEVLQQCATGEQNICQNCGKKSSEKDVFCRFCGAKIQKSTDFEQTVENQENDLQQAESNLQTAVVDEKVESNATNENQCDFACAQQKVCNEQAPSNQKQVSAFWGGVLSFLCPVVGFIMFAIWNDTKKHAAKVCLINAIVSIALLVVFYIAMYALYFWILANYGGINSIPLICAA